MHYNERLRTKPVSLTEVLEQGPEFVPVTFDCFSSMIAEDVGFKGMVLSEYAVGATYVGVPDVGLMTSTEMKTIANAVHKVTNVPMILDMDNGYGNELNAIRTTVDFVDAGAMAVIMNDQVFPKQYGETGMVLLPREEFACKCRAVVDTLAGCDAVLIARTDAYAPFGVEEAIARCNAAVDAGAKLTYVYGVKDRADAARIAKEVKGWKVFEMAHDGKTPDISFEELVEMGYRLVICPTLMKAAFAKYENAIERVYREKNDFFYDGVDLINGVERRVFLGLNHWLELGKQYNPDINVASKTKALD